MKRITVRFFRIAEIGLAEGLVDWPTDDDVGRVVADRVSMLSSVQDKLVEYRARNYYVDAPVASVQRFISVSGVRNDNLPMVLRMDSDRVGALNIEDDEVLLEPTYLLFCNDRVVAVVSGQHTPAARASGSVLRRIVDPQFGLIPVPDPTVLAKLNSARGIERLNLKIDTSHPEIQASNQDLVIAGRDVAAAGRTTGDVTLSLEAVSATERNTLLDRVQNLVNGLPAGVERLTARLVDEEGRIALHDLLAEELAVKVEVDTAVATRHLPARAGLQAVLGALADADSAIETDEALHVPGMNTDP